MSNILFLHAGAEWYGADKILVNIVRAINRQHRCLIILPENGILENHLVQLGVEVRVLRYPILRRSVFTPSGIIKFMIGMIISTTSLLKIARKEKIDIVYSNTFAVLEGAILKAFGYTHIWHIHEIITRPFWLSGTLGWLAAHFSDITIAVSDAVAIRIPGNQVLRIYNGISPIRRTTFAHGKINIGMLGRFNSWKGQLHLLKAYQILLKEGCENLGKLILCGGIYKEEFRYLEQVQEYINAHHISGNVEILPFTEDIEKVYSKIDVFVLPSTNPDPFPTVVLEAMSMGLPIIAYHHGGVVEMLEGNAEYLAQPLNIEDLALKIRNILSDNHCRIQASSYNLRRYSNEFSVDQFETRIQNLLQHI